MPSALTSVGRTIPRDPRIPQSALIAAFETIDPPLDTRKARIIHNAVHAAYPAIRAAILAEAAEAVSDAGTAGSLFPSESEMDYLDGLERACEIVTELSA
jgi:hypothetical protein